MVNDISCNYSIAINMSVAANSWRHGPDSMDVINLIINRCLSALMLQTRILTYDEMNSIRYDSM